MSNILGLNLDSKRWQQTSLLGSTIGPRAVHIPLNYQSQS